MGAPIKKKNLPYLCWNSERRFGLEFEINAFDGKNRPDPGQKPAGSDKVAVLVARNAIEQVEIREWEHTHGNEVWVIKPDSSCGMEVCTPIFKGAAGLQKCCQVGYAFYEDPMIKADSRCSVHVHVEVADLNKEQIASIIGWWFKVEPVFMDAMPPHRKRNRYCQFMGMTNIVQHDTCLPADDLLKRVGQVKYFSFNTNQMIKNGRKTVEFRTIEADGVKNPFTIKNWVRLITHYVEIAKNKPFPGPFKEGDQWSSYLWLDPKDVMKFLGFCGDDYELSPGLQQTRNWFLARMLKYMPRDTERGPRAYAYKELLSIVDKLREEGVEIGEECLHPTDMKTALFSDETKS